MNKVTFDVTLASLLKFTDRIYRRSMNCKSLDAKHKLCTLFEDNPKFSDMLKLMKNNSDNSTLEAICDISAKIAAPKEIYDSKNGSFGEKDNTQLSPLYSVFNRLNVKKGDTIPDNILSYDSNKKVFSSGKTDNFKSIDYHDKWERLSHKLKSLTQENADINRYLRLIYDYCSDVPFANDSSLKCDLSLYDHARLSAAFSGAMAEYFSENPISDYNKIATEKSVLLYSADFTGIQSFIYTITEKDALKTLRAKSFFVELVMENLIDEVLELGGLSRANLLYSGGGHCYIILPNLSDCIDKLKKLHKEINLWAVKAFGNTMCVVWDIQECSANDFLNVPNGAYSEIFSKLSAKMANRKLQKYSLEEILLLNSEISDEKNRECKICGKASSLVRSDGEHQICEWCNCFVKMSNIIMDGDMYFAILKKKTNSDSVKMFSLNDKAYLSFMNAQEIHEEYKKGNVKRVYCKNHYGAMKAYNESRVIYVCDYQKDKELEKLAESSVGITRLGVLRMDVDNLGNTFVSGFKIFDEKSNTYCDSSNVSIARTSSLSQQLSVFFKRKLTEIFNEEQYKITVIYAGGDDVFLVGAWNDVIAAAQKITDELSDLSDKKLTASGGIGIYESKYPIAAYAVETEALEACAKHNEGKASITLFEANASNTYKWTEFQEKVQSEKLTALRKFIRSENSDKGMSFLYKLLEYLRGCENDKINLARVAYLLGKMCSEKNLVNKEHAKEFSDKIYKWVTDEQDRKQLITAIYIFVYSERNGVKDDKQ